MQGQGVTNYSTEQPSYAFSGETTEFDDALIQRGIITKEQALAAKGMSVEDAQRLAAAPPPSVDQTFVEVVSKPSNYDDLSDDDDSFLDEDEDDDEFMRQYREKRVAEMKQERTKTNILYGEPVIIDRTEWKRHVNQDSHKVWVVVCLTSSDTERTGCVEQAVQELAPLHPATKFVLIAAHSAIPNWPVDNLPSLFLYRHGKMQHELVRLPINMTAEQLEHTLQERSVV